MRLLFHVEKGGEKKRGGRGAIIAKERASLDIPNNGQDDTSLGEEEGGGIGTNGGGDSGITGGTWLGVGGIGPPCPFRTEAGTTRALMLTRKWT